MKLFKYTHISLDSDDLRKCSYVFAKDKIHATQKIQNKGINALNISEISLAAMLGNNKLNELENIFWQLGFGINSNLGLIQILESIRTNLHYKDHIILLDSIIAGLNGGEAISSGLKKHSKICGNLVVVLFEIGEKSGNLKEMCELSAKEIKQKNEFIHSIYKALIYPCILVISCVIAFFILSIYVLPEFAQMYKEMQTNLPKSTELIISMTNLISQYFSQIIIFFITLIFLIVILLRKKILRDKILLCIPIFNRILLDYELYRYFLGLYYFLTSKVSFLESINICNSLVNNASLKAKFAPTIDFLNKGHPLSFAFSNLDIEIANIALLQSGEKGGAFDKALQLNYEFYKKRYTQSLQNISTLIEPLITIVMGLFITWLAFSVVSPMWQLLEVVV